MFPTRHPPPSRKKGVGRRLTPTRRHLRVHCITPHLPLHWPLISFLGFHNERLMSFPIGGMARVKHPCTDSQYVHVFRVVGLDSADIFIFVYIVLCLFDKKLCSIPPILALCCTVSCREIFYIIKFNALKILNLLRFAYIKVSCCVPCRAVLQVQWSNRVHHRTRADSSV